MGCIAGEESIEKCQKIDNLHLSVDEWKHIQIFEMLLDVSTHIIYIVPLDSDIPELSDCRQGPTGILLCHSSHSM